MDVLDEIRARLDETEAESNSTEEATVIIAGTSKPATDGAEQLPPWWKPASARDVRQLLPPLYGQCAVSEPNLLERALDALWAERRRDSRPDNQTPEPAGRVLIDRLANLGDLADASFPARIVNRVSEWLDEPVDVRDVSTPLFILRPLIAKEGFRSYWDAPRKLTFEPFLVSATWAQPIRDEIRGMLTVQACGTDMRRAAEAVELLGQMLRRPSGLFGHVVSDDAVLSWESDDLRTLVALREVAETTPSAVIRRMVRRAVTWTVVRTTWPSW
jgi:hypothetical protein